MRLLAGAAILGGLFLSPALALAERDINAELAATRAAQAETAAKAKKLASEVDRLKKKLVSAGSKLREAETTLQASDGKLRDLQGERRALLARLYRDENSFQDLLGAARRYDRTPTPLLMLRHQPLDAARTTHLMKSLLPSLQSQSSETRDDLAALAKLEDALTDEKTKNEKELKDYNSQQAKLDKLLQERQKIYKETEADRKAQERDVARLAREAKNLEELVAKIRQKPQFDRETADLDLGPVKPGAELAAGSLPAKSSRYALPSSIKQPVTGTVRTGFGEKDDLGALAKGITFTTRPGASVVAPLAGKVRFAGPFQKYRRILIIEHHGGYHSLIAGLGRIDTVVGAKLSAGEPVGASEPDSQTPLIYYELRHNGKPVNPQKLALAQQRKKEKT
jgi:septal ring factor EnvC (AmiA/AmiB activator)